MPLAELGAFSRRQAKLLACRLPASLYYSAHGIALHKYSDIAWRQKLPGAFLDCRRQARRAVGRDSPLQCHTPQGLWLAWESSTPA